MKLKLFVIIGIMLTFNLVCFAQIKTFTKEGESVVQKDQSVNQVIAYLKQKLTREAQEEAGIFITTNLKIENYKIKKDEFTSFAGSISKTTVLEEKSFNKNNENYVKVKIKVAIDIDNVKTYLEKIMQDNEYKEQATRALQEAEELRKKNLELENKLKIATKQEYEQKLSLQAEQQIREQKQRAIELNKLAIQAKEELLKTENLQKEQELQRQEKFNALQKQIEEEDLKAKERIIQEKENINKQELENKAKIKELEENAKKNMDIFNKTSNLTLNDIIKEAKTLKEKALIVVKEFNDLLISNNVKLVSSYNKQIEILKERKFIEKEPIKYKYEETIEFNNRVKEYNQRKKEFYNLINEMVQELEKDKNKMILKDEKETLTAMVKTTQPFIEKIRDYQNNLVKGNILKPISANKFDIDSKYFYLNFEYNDRKYSYEYDFYDIGKQLGISMYETYNSFIIEPYYSFKESRNGDFVPILMYFNIKHLGTEKEQRMKLTTNNNEIDDMKFYELVLETIANEKKLNKLILQERINIIRKKKEKIKQSMQNIK